MSRPICFRAWHEGRKAWLHSGKPPSGGCHILGETIWTFGEWCRVPLAELNDVVVEQFTGLIDKNGVEIYEGDILSSIRGKPQGIVRFGDFPGWEGDESTGWYLAVPEPDRGEYRFTLGRQMKVAICGNIHNNPEMLKP